MTNQLHTLLLTGGPLGGISARSFAGRTRLPKITVAAQSAPIRKIFDMRGPTFRVGVCTKPVHEAARAYLGTS